MRELIRFHLGGVELRAWRVLSGALTRRWRHSAWLTRFAALRPVFRP